MFPVEMLCLKGLTVQKIQFFVSLKSICRMKVQNKMNVSIKMSSYLMRFCCFVVT